MKTRSFLLALFTLTLGTAVAPSGTKAQQQNTMTGIWSADHFGFEMVLMLHADHTGEFDGMALTYPGNRNALMLTSEGVTTPYPFEVKADQLILSRGDLEGIFES